MNERSGRGEKRKSLKAKKKTIKFHKDGVSGKRRVLFRPGDMAGAYAVTADALDLISGIEQLYKHCSG